MSVLQLVFAGLSVLQMLVLFGVLILRRHGKPLPPAASVARQAS
ncbi:MAG TPA: hypothetical protein VFT38_06940 [Vicinamibacteria bacterium]|nr:hypothetical protein [Vicinamibacteria bacterium]